MGRSPPVRLVKNTILPQQLGQASLLSTRRMRRRREARPSSQRSRSWQGLIRSNPVPEDALN
eukprot:8430396-Pyramimonas_sp.AAC.1